MLLLNKAVSIDVNDRMVNEYKAVGGIRIGRGN
jgi:hypothetical protein